MRAPRLPAAARAVTAVRGAPAALVRAVDAVGARAAARAARRAVPLVLAVWTAGCFDAPGPGEWEEVGQARWRSLHPRGGGDEGRAFEALDPERTGITAANAVPAELALENRTLADGSGVAIGDYDGDGLPDVYLARVAAPNVLYRNLGDWRFEDVTDATGAAWLDRAATGAAFADVDGDGDLDLLLTATGSPNGLLRNDGGIFTDVSAEAGFRVERASRSLALADVDGDRDLDLYIANNKTRVARDMFPPEDRTLERVVVRDGGRCEVAPDLAEHWRVICEGQAIVRLELAEEDEFYLNDGTGRFERVSFTDGRFLDRDGQPLPEAPRDWGLSVRFHDLDRDGDADLYVCNDFETPDRIWMNDGTGSFRAASNEAFRTTSMACMAVDFSDVDRDGLEDLFAADMEPPTRSRRLRTIPPLRSDTTAPGAWDTRVQRARNTLQLAREDGTWYDIAPAAGVSGSEWSWASLFLDVDLDGYEDLLVANGHVWDMLDADTGFRVGATRSQIDWREEQRLYPPGPARNLAFRNNGDRTFEERGEAWGFASEPDVSHGMAAGDLDLDGDLDLVLTRLDRPPLVLRNTVRTRRVAVRLAGRPPNTAGVGAVIRVTSGYVPVQVKEVSIARSYLSGSEPLYAFASGRSAVVDIEVRWPGGAVSHVDAVPPNRLVEIREPEEPAAGVVAGAGETAAGTDTADGADAPGREGGAGEETGGGRMSGAVFEPVPLDHVHVDPSAPELLRQPLLSERLAQSGPGVTWYDAEGDGDPDLAIGAGRGGRLARFRNDDGVLRPWPIGLEPTPFDQTTILPLPAGEGRTALLVGRMSYEAESPDAARAAAGVIRVGSGGTAAPIVPGSVESVGPLALADVDGDGDLDLFVGGRVFPGRYPMPVSSHIYRNGPDGWTRDAEAGRLFESLGVVTSALFTDIEGDGDPDLALALDWGSIRVFRNEGGRFRDATRQLGLDDATGRWIGLASGDLDEDGRPDLVATSWGWNLRDRPRPGRPLLLYHGDADQNGTYGMIRAQADPEVGGIAPLESLERLGRALPSLSRTVPSFEAYAASTLTTVLGPAASRMQTAEAASTSHTVFLNREDGFEAVPLPFEAQVAPSFFAGVADYDGDGHDDVFLTQNFFATVPGVGRYDAGRSLWLSGDGTGALAPVAGSRSGVKVYGDPRGAAFADFDGDRRIDLAVSQNGAGTRLFRNAGAEPGLRVRLVGPAGNPHAVGAALRVVYADDEGPLREIQAGSGYWSVNDAAVVLGLRGEPEALWIRWPDGAETRWPLEPGRRDVVASRDGLRAAP